LVQTLGHNCEVAIHDLSNLESSLIYIAGEVTGRRPGAPITDLVVKQLHRHGDNVQDIINYRTLTSKGRILKSSTMFIRDGHNKVIGAFCINFDVTDFLNAASLIQGFSTTKEEAHDAPHIETFATSLDETVGSLIDEAVSKFGKLPSTMSREEKIRLVGVLEDMGVFSIKGSVDSVAQVLGVSIYTVYNYLKQVRNTKRRL
jgi:predicted transcriptional regulator YheO